MLTSFLKPQPRKCDECKACCTAIAVSEIKKPFMAKCEHECEKGCGIYGHHPSSCQGYECGWLLGLGQTNHRPDKIGAVLHHELDEHGMWIQVHCHRQLTHDEFEEIMTVAEQEYKTLKLRGIKLLFHDQVLNARFTPDPAKYPGCENYPDKTIWKTRDGVRYILQAPKRIPLKVI